MTLNFTPVLVTGASGFLGSAICRAIAGAGIPVRALIRNETRKFDCPGAEFVAADLQDRSAISKATLGISTVIHCAALVGPLTLPYSDFYRANVEGTRMLLDVCSRVSSMTRFVHVSTVAVVGSTHHSIPASETATCHPLDDYGRSKLQAEHLVSAATASGFPTVIARPMWIYHSVSPVTANLFRRIENGRFCIVGPAGNLMQPIALKDAVSGILKCASVPGIEGRTYNLAGPDTITIREMCEMIADVTGAKPPIRIPLFPARLAAKASELIFPALGLSPPVTSRSLTFFQVNNSYDIQNARDDLNWRPEVRFRSGAAEVASDLGLG